MRKGVLPALVVAAASSALITAALVAGPGAGVSFDGTSAHGAYGLFVQARCRDGCTRTGGVAVVQLTAGATFDRTVGCPWGANQLADAPIVDGRFASGEWLFLANKTFVWLWVSGRMLSPTRIVGRIQGPPACGGTDTYRLNAATVSG